jgi:hypothetical protein
MFYLPAGRLSINAGFAEQMLIFIDEESVHNAGFAEQPHR